jgi:Uma2 family endonuclease
MSHFYGLLMSKETKIMATIARSDPMSFSRSGTITFEDFCAIIKPKQKADLIDGVIFMASPENIDSHRLFSWLYRLISDDAEGRELGEVFGSRVAFRLDEKHGPEPDIAFVRRARLHLSRKTYFDGPPDLAIEIVSPESVERDYVTKRALYQQSGVAEYWIIDEELRKVIVLRPDRKGADREVRPVKGAFSSRVLDGFRLRPEWLWQTPRPPRAQILALLGPADPSQS